MSVSEYVTFPKQINQGHEDTKTLEVKITHHSFCVACCNGHCTTQIMLIASIPICNGQLLHGQLLRTPVAVIPNLVTWRQAKPSKLHAP